MANNKIEMKVYTLEEAFERAVSEEKGSINAGKEVRAEVINQFLGHLNNDVKENAMLDYVMARGYSYLCTVEDEKYFFNTADVVKTVAERKADLWGKDNQ